MKDTTDEVEALYRSMFARRTQSERLRMGCRMYHTSKRLVRASIAAQLGPEANEKSIRREVFKRFYGSDFTAEQCEAILAHLDHVGR